MSSAIGDETHFFCPVPLPRLTPLAQNDPKRLLAAVKLSKLLGRDLILTPAPGVGSPGAPV